jgi:Predicted membrane protein
MDKKIRDVAEKLFNSEYEKLTEQEKHVAHHITERTPISENVIQDYSEQLTFGQKMADKVASFGGSWMFIIIFMIVLVAWIILNSFILFKLKSGSFDPYPYIFLNLILSMLAAIQAPIILMSQNRQAYKDRLSAEHDYEVNLKSELEIIALHQKIDSLKQEQWKELISIQEEQLKLLGQLVEDLKKDKRNAG